MRQSARRGVWRVLPLPQPRLGRAPVSTPDTRANCYARNARNALDLACMHACMHARTHGSTHAHGSVRACSAAAPAPEHGSVASGRQHAALRAQGPRAAGMRVHTRARACTRPPRPASWPALLPGQPVLPRRWSTADCFCLDDTWASSFKSTGSWVTRVVKSSRMGKLIIPR